MHFETRILLREGEVCFRSREFRLQRSASSGRRLRCGPGDLGRDSLEQLQPADPADHPGSHLENHKMCDAAAAATADDAVVDAAIDDAELG